MTDQERRSTLELTDKEWAQFEYDDNWIDAIEYPEPVVFVDPYVYVIALDPGGTTGVACLRLLDDGTGNPIQDAKPELGYLHQIEDGRRGFKTFFNGSEIGGNIIMVSEKWKERNIKGADREPQYIEGGIHMLWDEDNVVWQYPDQKELIPDEWLKEQNLWTEGKRHQMDALKHAFAYLRNEGNSATLESLSGMADETMAQPGEADGAQLGDQGGSGEPGEGGEPAPSKSMAEAMSELAEAAQEAAEDEGATPGEGEGEGGAGEAAPGGYGSDPEDKRNRSRREVNGAFAGYNPADEETSQVTVLFED